MHALSTWRETGDWVGGKLVQDTVSDENHLIFHALFRAKITTITWNIKQVLFDKNSENFW